MSLAGLAIDCCWLVHADGPDGDFSEKLQVLAALDRSAVRLLFDHENRIQREYSKHLAGRLGGKFVQNLLLRGRVDYYSGSLTQKQNTDLDLVSFDPSDRPYLAVACRCGSSGYLTDEEKHLAPGRPAKLQYITGVQVLDSRAALAQLDA